MDKKALKFLWENFDKCLNNLSSPPKDQIEYLKQLGDISVDELALEFNDYWNALKHHINTESHESFYKSVTRLDQYLNEMSGTKNEALWSHDGLINSDEWHVIRRLAYNCKVEFEHLAPPIDHHDYDFFVSLDRRFSKKERSEEYWRARDQSKKEADHMVSRLKLYYLLFIGLFIISCSFYNVFFKKSWIKTTAHIVELQTYEKRGERDKKWYTYKLEYSVNGKIIQTSKSINGVPENFKMVRFFLEYQIYSLIFTLIGFALVFFTSHFLFKKTNI